MTNSPILKIQDFGQSIWIDHLNRDILQSGELKSMIDQYGLTGLTSNPAIFEKAIAGSEVYNADIEAGIRQSKSAAEIYNSLVFADIRKACDLLYPIYERTNGQDGFVSIEVSPTLARDADGTLQEARSFYQAIGRENVMIKIPGTPEGLAAIEDAIAEGINVNITLLFSVYSYMQTAEAYMKGLERRVEAGQPIDRISSVASFFLSRIDSKIDDLIDERLKTIGTETLSEEARLQAVKGKVAIANAKIAYQKFKEISSSDRWQRLQDKGAHPQRLLWASTSTKNPEYNDVMYVNELIGQHTVNTLPTSTLKACADHCEVVSDRIETDVDKAYTLIESLSSPDIGINLDTVMHELLEEGIQKFNDPFQSVMTSLEEKISQLQASNV